MSIVCMNSSQVVPLSMLLANLSRGAGAYILGPGGGETKPFLLSLDVLQFSHMMPNTRAHITLHNAICEHPAPRK